MRTSGSDQALWVPKTGIPSSGGDLVLVEEANEPVTPTNRAEVNHARSVRQGTSWGALIKGAVRSMGVVVLDVELQHTFEVTPAEDEQPIQTLPAQA